jgi:hypothetical protein
MTQAQLGINFTLANAEGRMTDIKWHQKDAKIICILNDDSSLVLRRAKQKTVLTLYNGRKSVDISMDQYEAMCDLKVGIQLLQSFLEGNSYAHTPVAILQPTPSTSEVTPLTSEVTPPTTEVTPSERGGIDE